MDAIKNKEAVLASVKDVNYPKIIDEARSRWIKYHPNEKQCVSIGIDSSWNKRSYQGLDFYVVDAVAVDTINNIQSVYWHYGLGLTRAEILENKGAELEAKAIEEVINQGKADIISVDGSIASRFVGGKPDEVVAFLDLIKKLKTIVFISKNSDTMKQFKSLKALAADMYYYNHIGGGEEGFSIPFEDNRFKYGAIVEVYARLREFTPLVKIEIVRALKDMSESDIKRILHMLRFHSVSGYPYCLKLAHNNCKIKNEDLDRLSTIYGLKNEYSARAPLNE